MDISGYLKHMVEKGASDLFLSTGAPVSIKIEGVTSPIDDRLLPPGETGRIARAILSDDQWLVFETGSELDVAVPVKGIGRFRINFFRQRGEVAIVIRYVAGRIPAIDHLHLPAVLKDLVMAPRGLVLVVGTTGSGKSTTLASMIDHRNHHKTGHILTIEDPIEFVHHYVRSIVNQREIGLDTDSYASALRRAMREAPDVILIGEIRDRETMEQAIAYAETGHLCLSTLHATNANQTLERIINFFPDSAHQQLYMDLALNLRAVVSQRLVRGVNGKRLPAVEVLLNTPYIAELIHKREISEIKEAMRQAADRGMQTFDQSLFLLYKSGRISLDEALRHADSHHDLALKIRLDESGGTSAPDELAIEK